MSRKASSVSIISSLFLFGNDFKFIKVNEPKEVNKKYMQKPINQNKILTQNVKIGLKAQKHRRNLNTLVCGGSRSRKNKIFCKTKCYAM